MTSPPTTSQWYSRNRKISRKTNHSPTREPSPSKRLENYELVHTLKEKMHPSQYKYLIPTCKLFKGMLSNNSRATSQLCKENIQDIVKETLSTNDQNRFILLKNEDGKAITIKRANNNFSIKRAKVIDSLDHELEDKTIMDIGKPVYKSPRFTDDAFVHMPSGKISAELYSYNTSESMPKLKTYINKYKQQGGYQKVYVLNRERNVITKNSTNYVTYKNELITLKAAKKLEKQLLKN